MADIQVNDLNTWEDQTPIISTNADNEFNVWGPQTPVEDRDEGSVPQLRRRAMEF